MRIGLARAIPYDDIPTSVHRGRAARWKSVLRGAGIDLVLEGLTPAVYNERRSSGELVFFTDELDAPVIADGHYELNQLYTSRAAHPGPIKFRETALVDPRADLARYLELLRQAQQVIVPLMPIIPISMTGTPLAMTAKRDTRRLLARQSSFVRFSDLALKA